MPKGFRCTCPFKVKGTCAPKSLGAFEISFLVFVCLHEQNLPFACVILAAETISTQTMASNPLLQSLVNGLWVGGGCL